MKNWPPASELLWEEQQRADRAQTGLEHRAWRKSFALVLGLIVLALTIATVLASLGDDGTIRL